MKPNEPEDYLEDFEELNTEPIMSLDRIEWWLLKYSDAHAEIISYLKAHHIEYIPYADIESHSHLSIISDFQCFLDFYHFINEISESARNEPQLKREMKEYHLIKDSSAELQEWITRNEKFGLGPYPQFIADANVFRDEMKQILVIEVENDVQFELDRNHFNFTLEFVKIFNELYCDKEILEG